MDGHLLAYLSFTAILVLTPGSTTAVVVRNALRGGPRAGLAAASGAAIANTSHAVAAGLGLAVVFSRWPLAMTSLSIAGGSFLAWLGIRSVYNVIKYPDGGVKIGDSVPNTRRCRGSLREGLAVNLLNPAIATFYLVVVPSFMPADASRLYFAMLAAFHIVMAFFCHGAWALALNRVRALFHTPLSRRLFEGATGIALLAIALRVLLR